MYTLHSSTTPHLNADKHTPSQTKETQANKHQVIQQAEVIDIIYNALAHHPLVHVWEPGLFPGGDWTHTAESHLLVLLTAVCVYGRRGCVGWKDDRSQA